jgi:hypothetical protein
VWQWAKQGKQRKQGMPQPMAPLVKLVGAEVEWQLPPWCSQAPPELVTVSAAELGMLMETHLVLPQLPHSRGTRR